MSVHLPVEVTVTLSHPAETQGGPTGYRSLYIFPDVDFVNSSIIHLLVAWSELHFVIHFIMGKCNSDYACLSVTGRGSTMAAVACRGHN